VPEATPDGVHVIGRLRPQVSRKQAQAEALVLSRQLEHRDPEFRAGWTIRVERLRDLYVEGYPRIR